MDAGYGLEQGAPLLWRCLQVISLLMQDFVEEEVEIEEEVEVDEDDMDDEEVDAWGNDD